MALAKMKKSQIFSILLQSAVPLILAYQIFSRQSYTNKMANEYPDKDITNFDLSLALSSFHLISLAIFLLVIHLVWIQINNLSLHNRIGKLEAEIARNKLQPEDTQSVDD